MVAVEGCYGSLMLGGVLWVECLGRQMDLERFDGCWGVLWVRVPTVGGSWGTPVGSGSWGVGRCLGIPVGGGSWHTCPSQGHHSPGQGAAPTHSWCHLQVNNNGVISFDEPVRQYTPDPFPLVDEQLFVAPYWGDVDNVLSGDIFYRQTTDPALLEDISKDITQYFPKSPFTATWALVATWDHVAYYGSTSQKVRSMVRGV